MSLRKDKEEAKLEDYVGPKTKYPYDVLDDDCIDYVKSSVDKDKMIIWENKMGEKMKYVDMLKDTRYRYTYEGLKYNDMRTGLAVPISNALIFPQKKINIYNGESKESYIVLKAIINTAEELPDITVPIKEIEKNSFYTNEEWGFKIYFGPGYHKNLQRDCIFRLALNIEEETIYAFTGFTRINGKMVYLHNGGAIGTDENIRVELEDEIMKRYQFTDKEFDIKETVRNSLDCLDMAPKNVTIPLFCFILFALLTSLFEEIGIPIGFLLYVVGEQQSKKTSIVTAFNSFFGNFDINHVAMTFLDSKASIAAKCNTLKDTPRCM